jgi:hypothetical protein
MRGKGRPAHKADNLAAICEPIVHKILEPRCLTTLWSCTACYRDSFTCTPFSPTHIFQVHVRSLSPTDVIDLDAPMLELAAELIRLQRRVFVFHSIFTRLKVFPAKVSDLSDNWVHSILFHSFTCDLRFMSSRGYVRPICTRIEFGRRFFSGVGNDKCNRNFWGETCWSRTAHPHYSVACISELVTVDGVWIGE